MHWSSDAAENGSGHGSEHREVRVETAENPEMHTTCQGGLKKARWDEGR